MKHKTYLFFALICATNTLTLPAHASPQLMNSLARQLNHISQFPLSGSLYIDSKLEYRFYIKRSDKLLEVTMRGNVFAEYTFSPESQKLVVKWPTQSSGITLGASENLKSIEWLIKSIHTGSLSETDQTYKIRRKLSPTVDLFELELEKSGLSKIEVSILSSGSTPTLLSVQALDPSGQEFLLLFD
jgi:hypothetical protein